MEYSQFCQRQYPGMKVTADIMQASNENRMIASFVGYAQAAGFAVAFFGPAIFGALSMPQPEWATYMQENKGLAIGGFFMGNIITGNLVQTGAFEIYLGPELLHSKIGTGVLPDVNWLVKELASRNPELPNLPPQVLLDQK
mmetsp:Transcript_1588/g.2166  ORF Transcript_1588/g.2166 Transcript_1588/m.2166 type:complete len:141 (-) Transcript_1588:584-1006(-)